MIDSMTANYGGTAMVGPIKKAVDVIADSGKNKGRIFILTDGMVSDRVKVF
jgi:hypothetical protein